MVRSRSSSKRCASMRSRSQLHVDSVPGNGRVGHRDPGGMATADRAVPGGGNRASRDRVGHEAEVMDKGEGVERNEVAGDRLVITIDGPAAAGKTTVASAVAETIDALFFDTGVIYRALTLAAIEHGVPADEGLRLTGLASHLDIRVTPPSVADGRLYDVWLEGKDVTWEIRAPEVDKLVSPVSAHAGVRRALLDVQRRIGHSAGRVVMAGRDVGTVVMPDADLKIWLDASLEERARRRQRELAQRGIDRPVEEVLTEMAERDRIDASRSIAPMKPAANAVTIQTDGKSVDEVVQEIVRLAEEQVGQR